jgi:hypothetical protein
MMYEYCLHGVGEEQFDTVGASMASLNDKGKLGWRVCLSLMPVLGLLLERQYEPVQAAPIKNGLKVYGKTVFLEMLGDGERHDLAMQLQHIMPQYRDPDKDTLHRILEDLLLSLGEYQYALTFPKSPNIT